MFSVALLQGAGVLLDVQCCYFLTLGQNKLIQAAKRRASALKRQKSRNRMETPPSNGAAAAAASCSTGFDGPPPRSESDGDGTSYVDEQRSGEFALLIFFLRSLFQNFWKCWEF